MLEVTNGVFDYSRNNLIYSTTRPKPKALKKGAPNLGHTDYEWCSSTETIET